MPTKHPSAPQYASPLPPDAPPVSGVFGASYLMPVTTPPILTTPCSEGWG